VKQAGYRGLMDWVFSSRLPTVVGMDANHWKNPTRSPDWATRDVPGVERKPPHPGDWWDENCFHLADQAERMAPKWSDGSRPEAGYVEQVQSRAAHGLRDAWLAFLRSHPAVAAQVRQADGASARPLGTSFDRGRKGKHIYDRFDYIYISAEFDVIDMEYDYEGGHRAGSDHALVRSQLRFSPWATD
jgi:hypothetical protein